MKFLQATASLLFLSSSTNAFMNSPTHVPTKSSSPSPSSTSSSLYAATQLEQLASQTTLSIDSGDLSIIQQYASTGFITDATTNPLFVSQAGLSGDPVYAKLVDDAVSFAIHEQQQQQQQQSNDEAETVALAIDRLAVNLGASIASIVSGYVSTEVNPKLAFDTDASINRGRRIIAMYETMGVSKDRILIKLPATWESILAAEVLQKEGINCNLTLIFSFVQAVACAQRDATLISPFTGRILDWHKSKETDGRGRPNGTLPEDDEGVVCCKKIYNYYKKFDHGTICMPASWRPSRGATPDGRFDLDEIRALAGTDRMTIPAPLLEMLQASTEDLPRVLFPDAAKKGECDDADCDDLKKEIGDGRMDEKEFRYRLNMDGCGTDKLAEGLRAFIAETEKLETVILDKVRSAAPVS